MNNEKKSGISAGSVIAFIIELAIVGVAVARQYIFAPDSMMFNLYDDVLMEDTIARILKTVVVLAGGLLVGKIATLITKIGEKSKNNKTKTTVLLLGNVVKYASAIGVIFIALAYWGIDTTAIATGAGVVTLIVGLGCQSMISDIVAGIFILFEGDIQVGDVIVVNGWRGTVLSIGLRRTQLVDTLGNINIINNSSITNVVNNTKELSLAICEVGIEYDESIERVEKILKDNFPNIKEQIPAIVQGPFYMGVSSLADSAVVIKIIAKVNEPDKFQTERDLNRAIKLIFDANKVNIPFNQITLSNREANTDEFKLTPREILETKKFLEEQKAQTRYIDDVDQ